MLFYPLHTHFSTFPVLLQFLQISFALTTLPYPPTTSSYFNLATSGHPREMRSRTNKVHRTSASPNPRPPRANAIHWLFSSNLPHRRSSAAFSADINRRNYFGMSEIFGVLLNVCMSDAPSISQLISLYNPPFSLLKLLAR